MSDLILLCVWEPGKNAGGRLVEEQGHLDGLSDIVIRIHGYHNSRDFVIASYNRFLPKL